MFLLELFKKFDEKQLDYVIIGGVALVLHGVIRVTADLDIMVSLDRENLERLLNAMRELGYRPRIPVPPEALLEPENRALWIAEKNMEVFSFYDPAKPLALVDIMIREEIGFTEMRQQAVFVPVDGLQVPVVAVDDLISLKKIAGRVQDLEDIKALEERKRRDAAG